MTDTSTSKTDVSADRPVEQPEDDLFGYAPFAKQLAESICSLKGLEGLVIALHGPWGAGKTTLLNLVRYYISRHKEEEQPVLVIFNPWWFSGQENITRAFLGQLQAVLPDRLRHLKKLGSLIGKFADGIATTADVLGYGNAGKVASVFKKKPQDVPELKKRLSDALRQQGRHILVLVDDIDRLTPDDLRQLFKVIKALADFPNVVYLLAFDKEVAVKALSDDKGISGEAYLEKIVQVPFELPAVDRTSLRKALFKKLDQVLDGQPGDQFDSTYWGNVYYEGIDSLIRVPRDIVRLINTLSVTYRAVRGEVNPVDFIAIESVRVFLPDVYKVVRANPDAFAGRSGNLHAAEQQQAQVFHDAWVRRIPDDLRTPVKDLLTRLFPKLESVWSNTSFGSDWELKWRSQLRICSADIFPVYFRLAVPEGAISKADLQATLQAAESVDALRDLFQATSRVLRPDGTSKARALLERLLDLTHDGIPSNKLLAFVTALLQVGDELLVPHDEHRGMFDFGNESRIARLLYHLLKREQQQDRCKLLTEGMAVGAALGVMEYFLGQLQQEVDKSKNGGETPLIDEACLSGLKQGFVTLTKARSQDGSLLSNPRLISVLYRWRDWGQEQDIRVWASSVIQSDVGLKRLLGGFVQRSITQAFSDVVGRMELRLNPVLISPFVDIALVATRVEGLLKTALDENERLILAQFSKEYSLIQAGKNPDAPFAFDDEPE
jgi:predicted KAP-like P-loop ATPase